MSEPADDRRAEARRLADELIDYMIYAPLGAAIAAAEELPELVRRGRERFGPRIALAQMMGKFAADSAKRRAEALVRHPADRTPAGHAAAPDSGGTASDEASHLAIPCYDTLTAVEILARLSGLTPQGLAAVRSFEMAHRARRTVLARIAQLLGERAR